MQTWVGHPLIQTPHDLWTIQETISAVRPALLIETGTFKGGSSMFYAHLMDLLDYGRIITVDLTKKHDRSHPRVTYLLGDSVGDAVVDEMTKAVSEADGPIMVILDSGHTAEHVSREMDIYGDFVTPGSYMLVQDGKYDSKGRPQGPLKSIVEYLPDHPEFEVEHGKCNRFLITHHPLGWLRRRATS
jgi:cephalosporin hydroxylase